MTNFEKEFTDDFKLFYEYHGGCDNFQIVGMRA